VFVPAPAKVATVPAVLGLWTTAADLVRFALGWSSLLPAPLAELDNGKVHIALTNRGIPIDEVNGRVLHALAHTRTFFRPASDKGT
jgi:hypothetical protein